MKTYINFLLIILLSIFYLSCNKNQDLQGKGDNNDKQENANFISKIKTINLRYGRGHLHGDKFHGDPSKKDSPIKTEQFFFFQKNEAGKFVRIDRDKDKNAYVPADKPLITLGSRPDFQKASRGDNPSHAFIINLFGTDDFKMPLKNEVAENKDLIQVLLDIPSYKDLSKENAAQVNNPNMNEMLLRYTYRDNKDKPDSYFESANTEEGEDDDDLSDKAYEDASHKDPDKIGLAFHCLLGRSEVAYTLNFHIVQYKEKGAKAKSIFYKDANKTKIAAEIIIPLDVVIPAGKDYPDFTKGETAQWPGKMAKYFNMTLEDFQRAIDTSKLGGESSDFYL